MTLAKQNNKLLFLLVPIVTYAGISFYNKVEDLKNNVKFFIDKFRVHGIVNSTYLRLFTTVRLINQAQSPLKISDLQVSIQYIDPQKVITDIGTSIQSHSFSIDPNQTQVFDLGTDLSLFSIPYDKLPGLLKGEKITVRIIASFTAFGKRLIIPSDQVLELPSAAISIINIFKTQK